MRQGEARYRVVVIGTSLGGVQALDTIFAGLDPEFPVPIVVVQHIGGSVSKLDEVLGRRAGLPVEWARDGVRLAPGRIYLCPPRHDVRPEPDGTLTVRASRRRTSHGQADELFTAAAAAYGSRALALVLTGLGSDGAAGAQAVQAEGGTVVVQDELTSASFKMPSAVIEAGAADLVLPLGEIAVLLDEVVGHGRRLPLPDVLAAEAVFAAGGEMGKLMADHDWSRSPLGPVERWPATLRTLISAVLSNPLPMLVMWGRSELQLYNDAYRQVSGGKHPAALGRPVRETFAEAVAVIGPLLDAAWAGRAVEQDDMPLALDRPGGLGESFWTFSYSPLRDGSQVAGVLCVCLDTTQAVISRRRLRALHELASIDVGDEDELGESRACKAAVDVLAQHALDVPIALIYLGGRSGEAQTMHLAAAGGVRAGSPAAPHVLSPRERVPWPVAAALRRNEPVLVDDLDHRFPGLVCAPWPEPPKAALLVPAGPGRAGEDADCVVLGVSPRVPLDDAYRAYLELVGEHVHALIAAAREHRRTRERMVALAELDRAKTELVANVSHEFRTPLTLMLLPLAELLEDRALAAGAREAAELAHRNALRLLRLVDTLLDAARIEQAQRLPRSETVEDLSALTADLASVFRSAAERAGLEFAVDCPPLGIPVQLDPEMWETIVLNLVSNALKHTFAGRIEIALRRREQHIELTVADTGVGIPERDLADVFTRFHRVAGARSRSREGSGIGLSHAHQLVRLHSGTVRVRSTVGAGSTFTVWLPLRSRPESPARPDATPDEASAIRRRAFAEEAELWIADATLPAHGLEEAGPPAPALPGHRRRVLIVDDNADMRAYLRRLLVDRYEITAAADGSQALLALDDERFDLVLTDVLMPEVDGMELLARIRTDPELRRTPVILLTAVADPGATLKGLAAGAHDFIVKPFTARELVARIEAQLALAALRDDAPVVRAP